MNQFLPNYIGMTAPRRIRRGYTRTAVAADGRTLVVSCLPQRDRNAATIAAWTLANDIRAGRADQVAP